VASACYFSPHLHLTVEVGTQTFPVDVNAAEEPERTRLYIIPTVENCAFLFVTKRNFQPTWVQQDG